MPPLDDDIPDEFRPLMRGLQSKPSARATPVRGIQLPTLTPKSPSGRFVPQQPPGGVGVPKPQQIQKLPSAIQKPPSAIQRMPSGVHTPRMPLPPVRPTPPPARPPSTTRLLRSTPPRGIQIATAKAQSSASNPASSGVRKMGWVCCRCHAKVDPQSIVNNEAVMVNGLPLCGDCVSAEKSQTTRKVIGGAVCALLALGTAVCLAFSWKSVAPAKSNAPGMSEAQEVEQIAQKGNLAEAEHRVSALVSKVESGFYSDEDVKRLAWKAEEVFKQRVKATFGELSPKEHELLLFLVMAYPGDGKHDSIRAVHVDDNNVASVTAVLDQEPVKGQVKVEIRALAVSMLQRFPKLNAVILNLQYYSNDTLTDAGVLNIDRAGAVAPVRDTNPAMVNVGGAENPSGVNAPPPAGASTPRPPAVFDPRKAPVAPRQF